MTGIKYSKACKQEISERISSGVVPGKALYDIFLQSHFSSMSVMARRLDVSVAAISRMISGRNNISALMALKISKETGFPAEDIMELQNQHDLKIARASQAEAIKKA